MSGRGIENSRVVLFANPTSSHAEKAGQFMELFQDSGVSDQPLRLVETLPPWEVDNTELLARALHDNDTVVVAGGDGTNNLALNGMIRSGRSGLKIMPLPCGNADDISQSLYSEDLLADEPKIFNLLENGEPRSLSAIKVIQDGKARYALGYVGIGLTGASAVRVNRPNYRAIKEKRSDLANRLTDALIVMPLLFKGRQNVIEYEEDGEISEIMEILISNIGRFAREFRIDLSAWEDKIVVNEFGADNFMLDILRRLATEQVGGKGLKGSPVENRVIELRTDARMQYDGEPVEASRGTVLEISHASDEVQALWIP